MTEHTSTSPEDPLDPLIVSCLQQPAPRRAAALEALCEQHPDLEAALRRRFTFLEDCGLIDGLDEARLQRLGEYRLLHRLGRGAMGVVYLAEQERLGRRVALKLVELGLARPALIRERFLREVRAVASLEHPNICPVYDAGEVDGVPYLVMRYIEGETLAEQIARQRVTGGRPDLAFLLETGACIAHALHAAHERGIVHRDVKPENIMLERSGATPLLLDFGLAQLMDVDAARLTLPGDQIGTPAYMASEQVAGGTVDRRTDVYGLGATLYEAFTLHVPHEAPTREALYRSILDGDVPRVGRHQRDLPRDLDTVLATALARDPAQRYATAAGLADDLLRIRDRQPIRARKPGFARRAQSWLRRHPSMALATVAAAAVAALGLALWQARQEIERGRSPAAVLDGPRVEPLWSTFFGGEGREQSVAVLRGPAAFVTIVGETDSAGFGTRVGSAAADASDAASIDAFVARFDTSQPPHSRLAWCSRFGGSGRESVFDGALDRRTGAVTIVGMTGSPDFPGGRADAGANDGFVVRLGADGQTIEAATRFGGTADDRICEVELDASGTVFVAGVTESDDLPARLNEHHGGPVGDRTDAFVARLEPDGDRYRVAWSLYLGGSGPENDSVASWRAAERKWVGNLDWMAMALAPDGQLGIAVRSAMGQADAASAWTSADALRAAPSGPADAYFAVVDCQTGALRWATYFGGKGSESPKAIAAHPDGGFVIGGATWSPDLPVTAGCFQSGYRAGPPTLSCDAFIAWFDPALGKDALRYATYFGADGGEDVVCALAFAADRSLVVAGFSSGGGLPLTRFLQPLPVRHGHGGLIARLSMLGRGAEDLSFATLAAGPIEIAVLLQGIALDEGAVWVTGISEEPGFPLREPYQGELATGSARRDGVLMRLRLPERR